MPTYIVRLLYTVFLIKGKSCTHKTSRFILAFFAPFVNSIFVSCINFYFLWESNLKNKNAHTKRCGRKGLFDLDSLVASDNFDFDDV